MSDILSIAVGEVWRKAGMVAKASGGPITAGTVNYYLLALTGANAGKWWKDADQTWAAVETANAMNHQADGAWTIELTASPFAAGVIYLEYAKESGDLHVAAEGKLLRGLGEEDIAQAVYDLIAARGTSVAAALQGSTLTIRRGDTLDVDFSGLGSLATRSKLWFTVQGHLSALDAASRIQIEETDGLTVIAGETATTPANGAIDVTDEAGGDLTVTLAAVETAKLTPGTEYAWDLQILRADGSVQTLSTGACTIVRDFTRAVA